MQQIYQVIESLSNALMEDRRVFGVPDGGDFLFRYNRQGKVLCYPLFLN